MRIHEAKQTMIEQTIKSVSTVHLHMLAHWSTVYDGDYYGSHSITAHLHAPKEQMIVLFYNYTISDIKHLTCTICHHELRHTTTPTRTDTLHTKSLYSKMHKNWLLGCKNDP